MAKVTLGEYSAFTNRNSLRFQKGYRLVSEKDVPANVVTLLKKQLETVYEPKGQVAATLPEVPPEVVPEVVPEETPEEVPEEAPEPIEDDYPQPTDADLDAEFLEKVSIHTASIQDIAQALNDRFGLYTVYLGRQPAPDENDPLTGEIFSKYSLGVAYQASIRARHTGVALSTPQKNITIPTDMDAQPATVAQARRQDTFEFRTSPAGNRTQPATEIKHETDENGVVHAVQVPIPAGRTGEFNGASAQYDAEEDELIVRPNMGKQVIRPDW